MNVDQNLVNFAKSLASDAPLLSQALRMTARMAPQVYQGKSIPERFLEGMDAQERHQFLEDFDDDLVVAMATAPDNVVIKKHNPHNKASLGFRVSTLRHLPSAVA